jgi:hypothetical protein
MEDVVGRRLFCYSVVLLFCRSGNRKIYDVLVGGKGCWWIEFPQMTLSDYSIHPICPSLKLKRQRVSKDMCSSRMSDHVQSPGTS